MQIGNRFRCYPTQEQIQILLAWIGCQRAIYNAKVSEDRYFRSFSRKCLALAGQHPPIDQQYSHFKTELTPWLSQVPSQVLRNGAVKWKQAYSRFFNKLGGRPTIRTRHGKQSVWLTDELFEFVPVTNQATGEVAHELRIGVKKYLVGVLQLRSHREYKIPNSISISVHAGRWHVSFSYDDEVVEPDEKDTIAWLRQHDAAALQEMTLGLDRGVEIPVAGSDGQAFGFSAVQKKRLTKEEKYRKRWQRRQARRARGSSNWVKAKKRVARYQRYGTDVRRDMAHKTSHRLADDVRYKLYIFEALKLKNMTASAKGTVDEPGKNVRQKAGLNRSLLGAALGQTKTYLQYKARRRGKLCLDVPPHYSSQECAACGFTHQDNRRTQAEFVCQCCGNTDNADINAGKVLAKRGVTLLLSDALKVKEKKRCAVTKIKVGAVRSEPAAAMPPTLVETRVRRQDGNVQPHRSLKQETLTTSHRL